jgi:hypothetical protein
VASVWPLDHAWSWSFSMPPDAKRDDEISLCLRQKVTPLAPHTTPAFYFQTQAMPKSQAARELGTGWFAALGDKSLPHSGDATVQVLDLTAIGAASTRPSQSLRVLATLSMGGSSTLLAGDDIYLPAGKWAGNSVNADADWLNDELYLMSFYIQREGEMLQYDAFLKRRASTMLTPRAEGAH